MKKSLNCAEAIDRMNRGVAWGMLVCGIAYFALAGEKLVEPGLLNKTLDIVSGVGVFLTLLVTFYGCWPVLRMKASGQLSSSQEPESFLTDAMQASFKNSWIATMMALVVALALQNIIDTFEVESSFYFIVFFGFMALSASISFLVIAHKDDLDDMEEE